MISLYKKSVIFSVILVLIFNLTKCSAYNCSIPVIIRGAWFSWENGRNTLTELDATTMTRRGICVDIKDDYHVNYTMVFKKESCFTCIKFIVRTVNVLDKMETSCISLPENDATIENVCRVLDPHQQLITLFSENYVPVNCRSSLEGVWNFAYQNRFKFTGECRNPDAQIRSCQTPGSQFLITNQKFNITYKKCEGMTGTFDGVVEYSCLGDWFVDKNHYFAVANTKESRKDEKYRCFLKNRDDDLYIGVSITAECNTLKTVEKSPERLHIKPVKSEMVEPGCRLPQNFTGEWINTANIDADIFINETHIIETWYPDEGRYRRTIYVCREQRDTRVMMARLTVDGCQKDYICFDFVPQHHNIIRYRRGIAVIKDEFSTVCSWVQFKNSAKWKYDLFLKRNPVPVKCPIAGKFNFTQKRGYTFCYTVSDPDYRMKCIGYWKENLKSYLITYDELDPFSKYHCWVYQRADLNKVLMSQAIGPFCDLKQTVYSWNHTEGATVAIEMQEYERERDQCPMHFDDGSDPWLETENVIQVFTFGYFSSGSSSINTSLIQAISSICCLYWLINTIRSMF
ncbi:hypothetical protein NQ314_017653 [Rhamnusium bicolor]|uniref:Uncharacterized protein n=1 Tax=Rhamnusium bicolor TaxID=1586634 RepID=A0AAV8WV91_9CUCU|nr:hypothetical protein NQ314_017653 [Rhamnusium bicolor]